MVCFLMSPPPTHQKKQRPNGGHREPEVTMFPLVLFLCTGPIRVVDNWPGQWLLYASQVEGRVECCPGLVLRYPARGLDVLVCWQPTAPSTLTASKAGPSQLAEQVRRSPTCHTFDTTLNRVPRRHSICCCKKDLRIRACTVTVVLSRGFVDNTFPVFFPKFQNSSILEK